MISSKNWLYYSYLKLKVATEQSQIIYVAVQERKFVVYVLVCTNTHIMVYHALLRSYIPAIASFA